MSNCHKMNARKTDIVDDQLVENEPSFKSPFHYKCSESKALATEENKKIILNVGTDWVFSSFGFSVFG